LKNRPQFFAGRNAAWWISNYQRFEENNERN
jgi:hypothetical protein